MTWVIGATGFLSRGALISDTRVTYAGGRVADLIQKVHPIGNFAAMGFAGSVLLGFEMIRACEAMIGPERFDPGRIIDPRAALRDFPQHAQAVFSAAAPEHRRLGCHLLVVAISPTEHVGVPEFPRVHVIRLVDPWFQPAFTGRGLQLLSIGTGASVPVYKRALRPLFRVQSGIHQAYVGQQHGWAETLTFAVTIAVRDDPMHGIGEHLHLVAISPGECRLTTNDMVTHPGDGEPIQLRMPLVARDWAEFNALSANIVADAATASC